MGLGLHGGGEGAARFMARAGAKVLVTDLKPEKELKETLKNLKEFKNIKYVLGQHRIEDFKKADLIIKNPAVPDNSKHLVVAKENKVKIDTDIGIFFELCPAVIIGVTGSKGKSTTASLIAEVLKKKFQSIFLAGNIRKSVLDVLPEIKKGSMVVLELSSWQLDGLAPRKKSPHIAVLTNIYKEHLNRYKSFKDYIKSKELIFKFQDEEDYLIINKDLRPVKTESQIIYYSGKNKDAAREIGKIYEIDRKDIEKAIKDFVGLEGRFELIGEINDIKFINDTCSTHPEATIYSLDKIKSPVVLIAGGEDKELDFSKFNKIVKEKVKKLILLPGSASDKIKAPAVKVKDMSEAVDAAIKNAESGDVVLLSPGAASFNLFKHEFHRGEEFIKYVKKQA